MGWLICVKYSGSLSYSYRLEVAVREALIAT